MIRVKRYYLNCFITINGIKGHLRALYGHCHKDISNTQIFCIIKVKVFYLATPGIASQEQKNMCKTLGNLKLVGKGRKYIPT